MISVIIAARNAAGTILPCVESVLAQDVELEVVLVDDASSDSTLDVLSELRDTRLRVISSTEHLGRASARNLAVSLATGHLLAIQDADDLSLPGRLRQLADVLEAHPEVAVVGGQCLTVDPRLGFWTHQRYPIDRAVIHDRLTAGAMSVCHTSCLIRREVFDEVGGYDPTFVRGQDLDLLFRISRSHGVANVGDALVVYSHGVFLPWHYWRMSRLADARVRGSESGTHPSWYLKFFASVVRRSVTYLLSHRQASAVAQARGVRVRNGRASLDTNERA